MASQPRMSIIIPARNAGHYLARALPAIQTAWQDDYELIVVNDASSDNTSAIAGSTGGRVINIETHVGPSQARNVGAAEAKGDILVFLDADVVIHKDTLSLLRESLETKPEIAAVFGSYDDDPSDRRLVSRFKNLMHHYIHQHGRIEAQTFWTGCGAIRKSVFEEIGPFHHVSLECVEDIDYGHRLRDAGKQIWLRCEVQCKHLKRWTLWGLIRTDIMQRGIPWTIMMLRRGRMDSDLNLGGRHRASAILAVLFGLSLAAMPIGLILWIWAGICCEIGAFPWHEQVNESVWIYGTLYIILVSLGTAAASLMGVVLLQLDFYRFLVRKAGLLFAVTCVPLHILYYWYSVISLVAGFVLFMAKGGPRN